MGSLAELDAVLCVVRAHVDVQVVSAVDMEFCVGHGRATTVKRVSREV